jgi:taurine dioxygenase
MMMRVQAAAVRDYNRIKVLPVTGSIGAEVLGIDLRDFDDEVIAEVHDAWMAHKVLFFREQELTKAQHVDYAKAFGQLEVHPFSAQDSDYPEILVLQSTPEKFQAAEQWHSDVTFRECPPTGSILAGRHLPPWGGDTCWANMEMAYERLPDQIKSEIEGKFAIHSYMKAFGSSISDDKKDEAYEKYPDQKHPVVRTHPVTGAKGIFINKVFTLTIDGMTAAESRPLRHQLYQQVNIPEFQCRFRWAPGSVAQWDNRITQHYAVPDHGGYHRRMERVTLVGVKPQ